MDLFSPQAITGLVTSAAPANRFAPPPALSTSAGPSPTDKPPPWSPENPLFWVGAVAALTYGLMAANASIRVGPFRATAGAGR